MGNIVGERREPVTVILLGIVTCGIYYYYWIYKVSEETQNYSGEQEMTPMVDLLLCIFVPLYLVYWFYKQSQKITRMQAKAGLPPRDEAVLHAVLGLLIGIVAVFMFQDNLNKIWDNSRNAQTM